jgi:hypothetical protein
MVYGGRTLKWPLLADFVAKPQAGSFLRNNRIGVAGTANRNCAATLVHESMLRAAVGKILLQQYRY